MTMHTAFTLAHKALEEAFNESSKMQGTIDLPEHYEAMLDILAVQQIRIDNALYDLEAANRICTRQEQSP